MSKKINKKRLEKIGKLAWEIVGGWDIDTLIEYTRDQMVKALSFLNKEEYDEVWAEGVVDRWDLDALIEYARDKMVESLSILSRKEFDEKWDDYLG